MTIKKLTIQHFLNMPGIKLVRSHKLTRYLIQYQQVHDIDKDIHIYDMLEQAKRNKLIIGYERIDVGIRVDHFDDTDE